jgi:hypothetical protein
MKIAINPGQLDSRGMSTVTYDYAYALRDILGHEPFIVTSKPNSTHPLEKFKEFDYYLYDDPKELPEIMDSEQIDLLYMIKAGNRDTITPTNVKTAVHCVFDMREEHGTVYAGVSEWLAGFFKKPFWVPHIVNLKKTTETLRVELGIPNSAFIVGRIGGYDQFDLPMAHAAIRTALDKRPDFWAIFLNTKPFIDHPRVKFIPFQSDLMYKSKFINTCDAMIHARSDGETFGLSVAEFSSLNKPVITYDADYWWYMRAHIHALGDRAILYKNEAELTAYLLQIDKDYVAGVDWDRYSIPFSPENVMKKFEEVFIK